MAIALTVSALAAGGGARADLVWEERGLPAGGRLLLAGGISPGLACVGLAAPAGTAGRPEAALLPLLAPRALLGAEAGWEPGASLEDGLARLGWRLASRCGLESAEISLIGPVAGLDAVLGHLLDRLRHPGAVSAGDLALAWRQLQADAARAEASPELVLREAMAGALYAGHPYARGDARPVLAGAGEPPLAALAEYLDERYQAGGLVLLVAGDLDPARLAARWQGRFDALTGNPPPPARSAAAVAQGAARLHETADATLLLYHFPGPAGDSDRAPAAALLAGVLNLFVQTDLRGAGLVSSGSAWYDFTCPGPRPLELQLRGFDPERLPAVEARVARILERLRAGDFSEYQVITAKDQLFTRIDAAAGQGAGPVDGSPRALSLWCAEVLREGIHFARWRSRFVAQALAASRESLGEEAARLLLPERATLGLLLPQERVD